MHACLVRVIGCLSHNGDEEDHTAAPTEVLYLLKLYPFCIHDPSGSMSQLQQVESQVGLRRLYHPCSRMMCSQPGLRCLSPQQLAWSHFNISAFK